MNNIYIGQNELNEFNNSRKSVKNLLQTTACYGCYRTFFRKFPSSSPFHLVTLSTSIKCSLDINCIMLLSLVAQSCLTLCSPKDCNPPGSPVHADFPGKNTSGLPCPPPGDLPNPGIEPGSPTLQVFTF